MKIRKYVCTMFNSKKKFSGLHFTTNHNGKMSGMYSLSTNNLTNSFCKAHKKCKGSICEKCFADTQLKAWKSMQKPLEENSKILKGSILEFDQLPYINALYFRFEAFGDLDNKNQFINYCNIARKNPKTTFTIWTKNPIIMDQVFSSGIAKPENMIIILSSLMLGQEVDQAMVDRFSFIDKVFTVYESEKACKEAGKEVHCGDRICIDCLRCYTKNKSNDVEYVNEVLK